MEDERMLNIVDENDQIIGVDTRDNIHRKGLLHRESHVWFYTSNGEIILQHRAKNIETYPDLLDATVSGHVEIDDDYVSTALKEMTEETGVKAKRNDLTLIRKTRSNSRDKITGKTNNVIRAVYAYRYNGDIQDLIIEEGKAVGFEAWAFDRLLNIAEGDKKRFIPLILEKEIQDIFRQIRKFVEIGKIN